MGKLTSIYNFVPLNEQVYYPSWADEVSQDAPFSDGEDGYIDVTLRNVSPLFIRNGNADRKSHDPHSAHVMVDGKRLYFLPATSIKGMLRTTLEIMSFGKMTQYTDRFFGWRDVGGKQTTNGKLYASLVRNVRPAWLRMEGEKLFITPCDGRFLRISYSDVRKVYPHFDSNRTGWAKNKFIAGKAGSWYPNYELDGKDYRLVCTGNMDNKEKEYLFPIDRKREIEVSQRAATEFFSVHEPSPDFDKVVNFLKSGEEFAVFYIEENNVIKAIGLSAMLRYPYNKSVNDIVKNQQFNFDKNRQDLAEAVFGYITQGASNSLRGRVQIGNAFSDTPLADNQLLGAVSGVQGQPKASYYPFYLKQTHNPYKTYQDAEGIAGRKLYRVHRGSTVTKLPIGNGNENLSSRFCPIPAGQKFHLRIAVHNLRKMEIGALLSAITLHNTPNVWHNIGLARGFGYGKLKVESVTLSNSFSHKVEDYLKEFELQMSIFTYGSKDNPLWINTPQIQSLMGILSEHNDSDLHVMDLNEYSEGKKNANFTLLEESGVPVRSLLTDADKGMMQANYDKVVADNIKAMKRKWTADHKEEFDKVSALAENHKFDEANTILNSLIDELKKLSLDSSDVETLQDQMESLAGAFNERQEQEAKAKKAQAQQEKFSAGLGAILDEVFAEGTPKAGQYKVADFKGLNNRTDQWIKKLKETSLTDSEKSDYASTFRRLARSGNHSNKEDKDLANKNSKLWQTAQKRLGDNFDNLLGDLFKQ